MRFDWILEGTIMLFILGGIFYAVWKGGARNPIGTATLEKQIKEVANEVDHLSEKVEKAASADDVTALRDQFSEHRKRITELFTSVDGLKGDISKLSSSGAVQNNAIEALAKSIRAIDQDLKEHRAAVLERLELISDIDKRVAGNAQATKHVPGQIAELLKRDRETQAALAKVQTQGEATHRQLEHIVKLIIEKGMKA